MSSSIDPAYVPWHIYERDMQRINEALDKLILATQNQAISIAQNSGEDKGKEAIRGEQRKRNWALIIAITGAILTLVGSFILNIIQVS